MRHRVVSQVVDRVRLGRGLLTRNREGHIEIEGGALAERRMHIYLAAVQMDHMLTNAQTQT